MKKTNRITLIGDSRDRPFRSGRFGMNLGIQNSIDLALKLRNKNKENIKKQLNNLIFKE